MFESDSCNKRNPWWKEVNNMKGLTNTIWRHYKGGLYTVIDIAIHTETNEEMVVYTNSNGKMFARPLAMFVEDIHLEDGTSVNRFVRV